MSDYNAIDTTRRLEGRGFTRDQAETLAQLLADLWGSIVTRQVLRAELAATREDLGRDTATLRADVTRDITAMGHDIDQRLVLLEQSLDGKITLLGHNLDGKITLLEQNVGGKLAVLGQTMTVMEQRLLLRLGGVIVVAMGAFSTIAHYWR